MGGKKQINKDRSKSSKPNPELEKQDSFSLFLNIILHSIYDLIIVSKMVTTHMEFEYEIGKKSGAESGQLGRSQSYSQLLQLLQC